MDKQGDRLHMLQRNNQQLSAELSRVREENQRLEHCLAECRTKQVEYMDTLAAVDRTWSQLTDDMKFLAQRAKQVSPSQCGRSPKEFHGHLSKMSILSRPILLWQVA